MSIPSISGSRLLPWSSKVTVPIALPSICHTWWGVTPDPCVRSLYPINQGSLTSKLKTGTCWSDQQQHLGLDIKCRIIVMCLTHPKPSSQLSVHGKIVFRETGLWCQKVWGLLQQTIGVSVTVSRLFSVEAGRL